MEKENKLWTMRNGQKIRLGDMSKSHLVNTIAMLERVAKKTYESEMSACMSLSFSGEMAHLEQDRFIATAEWSDFLPDIYWDMKELTT